MPSHPNVIFTHIEIKSVFINYLSDMVYNTLCYRVPIHISVNSETVTLLLIFRLVKKRDGEMERRCCKYGSVNRESSWKASLRVWTRGS
jgi:hypothetical protein